MLGAWWEHFVLTGWICLIVAGAIERCTAQELTTVQALGCTALGFVVSTMIVLASLSYGSAEGPDVWEPFDLVCVTAVCYVHEVIGRFLVWVVCMILAVIYTLAACLCGTQETILGHDINETQCTMFAALSAQATEYEPQALGPMILWP